MSFKVFLACFACFIAEKLKKKKTKTVKKNGSANLHRLKKLMD